MCTWLLVIGVNLRVINAQGHSALHKAAFNGHGAVAAWLVRYGNLDVSVTDKEGYTAAAVARERGHDWLASTLMYPTLDD